MLVHDVIKIKYSRQGYLPNYPPHLISDEEMCRAFLDTEGSGDSLSYFRDNYPCLFEDDEPVKDAEGNDMIDPATGEVITWNSRYDDLVNYIASELNSFMESKDDDKRLPDWIYAYMAGSVVSVNSTQRDIHDLLVMLDIDNLDDEFLSNCCKLCYKVSEWWLKRVPEDINKFRPPALFGEPHVLKQLKLAELGLSRQVV